jgi:hypothetical protein
MQSKKWRVCGSTKELFFCIDLVTPNVDPYKSSLEWRVDKALGRTYIGMNQAVRELTSVFVAVAGQRSLCARQAEIKGKDSKDTLEFERG